MGKTQKLDRRIIRRMILEEARILNEERRILEGHYKIACYFAEKEAQMLSEGFTHEEINQEIINELSFGDILSGGAGFIGDTFKELIPGFTENIEQYFVTMVLQAISKQFDPNSLFGSVIVNVIENIDVMTFTKYFKAGNCEPIVETLTNGIVEALVEQGLNKVFGVRSDSGFIAGTAREAMQNAIRSQGFVDTIKSGLRSVFCEMDFEGLKNNIFDRLSGLFSGSTGGAAAPRAAGSFDPATALI